MAKAAPTSAIVILRGVRGGGVEKERRRFSKLAGTLRDITRRARR